MKPTPGCDLCKGTGLVDGQFCLPCVMRSQAFDSQWQTKGDRPIPEDAAIEAAFPTRSGRHDLYGVAMRLVGAKYSKSALVALVNMLLHRAEPKASCTHDDARAWAIGPTYAWCPDCGSLRVGARWNRVGATCPLGPLGHDPTKSGRGCPGCDALHAYVVDKHLGPLKTSEKQLFVRGEHVIVCTPKRPFLNGRFGVVREVETPDHPTEGAYLVETWHPPETTTQWLTQDEVERLPGGAR